MGLVKQHVMPAMHALSGNKREEVVVSKSYLAYFIKEMVGEKVPLEHFQITGMKNPIFVREKTGLHK